MSASSLMPVEEAIERLLAMADAQRLQDSETVPLGEARQRVLANDLVATLDLPPWPNSAMDGPDAGKVVEGRTLQVGDTVRFIPFSELF